MAHVATIAARDASGHMALAGRQILMLASNDYLGLSTDSDVAKAIASSIERYGTGTTIYPVFAVSDEHRALEDELARFLGVEAVMLTVSGGAANAVALTGLVGDDDLIFSDSDNHASTIDAGRLSRDTAHLAELLEATEGSGKRLVITNGVFSMDGGLAPLAGVVELCGRHGAQLVVDDAHATGVVGPAGRGSLPACGLFGGLPATFLTGSLSKALGGAGGGFVAGPHAKIEDLRARARSYVFTQGMTSAATAAALAALRKHVANPSIHHALWRNIEAVRTAAVRHGMTLLPSDSAILTLRVGDEESAGTLQARLLDRDIFAQAMTFPIVPKGAARLRIQPSAAHQTNELEAAIAVIAEEFKLCACPPNASSPGTTAKRARKS
jgi:7-keto-8-aminopelargonate synthetase-like enzyme